MIIKLAVEDELLQEAKSVGPHRTIIEAVTAALKFYIRIHKQREITEMFGTVVFDNDYDYKKSRKH